MLPGFSVARAMDGVRTSEKVSMRHGKTHRFMGKRYPSKGKSGISYTFVINIPLGGISFSGVLL